MLCDPSHMGGKRERVLPIAMEAMERGYAGLIIESHIEPDNAWTDAGQQITPSGLTTLLSKVLKIYADKKFSEPFRYV